MPMTEVRPARSSSLSHLQLRSASEPVTKSAIDLARAPGTRSGLTESMRINASISAMTSLSDVLTASAVTVWSPERAVGWRLGFRY